ncbi:MAG: hypothetical protein JW986_10140 [Methanotrichaceae archaeon]|nr:hypothetical protein [Methanotrichaceae archaeon]
MPKGFIDFGGRALQGGVLYGWGALTEGGLKGIEARVKRGARRTGSDGMDY